jgi:hypothetical protein
MVACSTRHAIPICAAIPETGFFFGSTKRLAKAGDKYGNPITKPYTAAELRAFALAEERHKWAVDHGFVVDTAADTPELREERAKNWKRYLAERASRRDDEPLH